MANAYSFYVFGSSFSSKMFYTKNMSVCMLWLLKLRTKNRCLCTFSPFLCVYVDNGAFTWNMFYDKKLYFAGSTTFTLNFLHEKQII